MISKWRSCTESERKPARRPPTGQLQPTSSIIWHQCWIFKSGQTLRYMVLKAVFSHIYLNILYSEGPIIKCDDLTPVGVDILKLSVLNGHWQLMHEQVSRLCRVVNSPANAAITVSVTYIKVICCRWQHWWQRPIPHNNIIILHHRTLH